MKPFDIEQAKAGKPVINRRGDPVTVLDFDYKAKVDGPRILYKVHRSDHSGETVWSTDCKGAVSPAYESSNDLFMAPTKVKMWMNICHNGVKHVYDSERVAKQYSNVTGYSHIAVPFEIEL